MSCSSTATGDPATDISYRVVTNAISPLRPDLTTTSATAARHSSTAPNAIGACWVRRPPANIRFRPGIGGRNGPAAGWPSAPIADWAGWSRRVNQCHIGGSGPSGGAVSSNAANAAADQGSTRRDSSTVGGSQPRSASVRDTPPASLTARSGSPSPPR